MFWPAWFSAILIGIFSPPPTSLWTREEEGLEEAGRAQGWLYWVTPGSQELKSPLCLVPRNRRAKALVTASYSME